MWSNLKTKINSSTLLKRIMNAFVFGIGGAVGSRALFMLSGIIISRVLGKEHYGQFSMINSTVTLFVTFSGIGIGATLTRYVALYRNQTDKLGNIVGTLSRFVELISILMSAILFLNSSKLSFWVSGNGLLTNYFRITSLIIFISTLASLQQSILLGMEKYKKSAKIELIRCGVYLIIGGFFSIYKGVNGAVWALLITHFLRFYLMYNENRKEYKENNIIISYNFNSGIRKILLQFTIPSFVASLFVMPVNWINNSILTRQVGFGELAIFAVAQQWMTIVTYVPSQMGQIKPIYTDLFAQNKCIELKRIFKNITLSSIALVLPIALIGITFSKYILNFYGNGYEYGYITFVLLMIAAFLITLQSQVGALLEAVGKMWAGFFLNFIWSVVIVGIFYYLRGWGSMGYAMAYCIAYAIHNILSYGMIIYLWKRMGRNSEKY